jgi:hypothetical protein
MACFVNAFVWASLPELQRFDDPICQNGYSQVTITALEFPGLLIESILQLGLFTPAYFIMSIFWVFL